VNRKLVSQIWLRAASRCEYCRLSASLYPGAFVADHIIAKQHGGATDLLNLALCCLYCNAPKGLNIAGIDPLTGESTGFFIRGRICG
jgi:5-methylcytosine-specific restriction endonuclease McrA